MAANKPVNLRGSAGILNTASSERFTPADLQTGTNIDIDETGKIWRRKGRTLVSAGSFHSLWSKGSNAFVVSGTTLNRVQPDLSLTPIVSGILGSRVAYEEMNGDVYWSDNMRTGILSSAGNRSWGLTVPDRFTGDAIGGALPPGRYMYTLTFIRNNMESGASTYGITEVSANQGLRFASLPVSADAGVTQKRLYLTRPNGEVPYSVGVYSNATTSVDVTDLGSMGQLPCRTAGFGPLPAGNRVALYNGRLYVASGSFVCYSLPYEYELCDLTSGFIPMDGEVRTVSPVVDGLFVSTEKETGFMEGPDALDFRYIRKAGYGGVMGTEFNVLPDLVGKEDAGEFIAFWVSARGICMGTRGGAMRNLSSDRYLLPAARVGASLLKIRGGTPHFVTSLFN